MKNVKLIPIKKKLCQHYALKKSKSFNKFRCDIVIALELDVFCLPKTYPTWIQTRGQAQMDE